MFSIRDLIDVWGLPHLNKVGIKYKEIEFQMGSLLISQVFLVLMRSF